MHKYKKIYYYGHKEIPDDFYHKDTLVDIFEKVDGANFRFQIKKDGFVLFGSKNRIITEVTADAKSFHKAIEFVKLKVEQFIDKHGVKALEQFEDLTFYAENMVRHTLDYNWDITPLVLGFDVMTKGRIFYHWKDAKEVFAKLGIDFVPVIKTNVRLDTIIPLDDTVIPKSKYAECFAEGVVLKSYEKQIYCKYVSDKFKETNKIVFGHMGAKRDRNNEERFIATFCRIPRIDKLINSFVDAGHELDIKMMKLLPKAVWIDIWEEEWKSIRDLKYSFDFKVTRKLIGKMCKNRLFYKISSSKDLR